MRLSSCRAIRRLIAKKQASDTRLLLATLLIVWSDDGLKYFTSNYDAFILLRISKPALQNAIPGR